MALPVATITCVSGARPLTSAPGTRLAGAVVTVHAENGDVVARGTRPEDFWDGTLRGRPAPDGVYFVVAKAKNVNVVEPVVLTGTLHVLH